MHGRVGGRSLSVFCMYSVYCVSNPRFFPFFPWSDVCHAMVHFPISFLTTGIKQTGGHKKC